MGLLDKLKQIFNSIFNRKEQPKPAAPDPQLALDQLRRYQDEYRLRAAALTNELTSGQISLTDWRVAMEQELRYLHTTAAAIGRGGFGNLTAADLTLVSRTVEDQLTYLDRWVNSLRLPTINAPGFQATRAQMYAGAATATMYDAMSRAMGMPQLPAQPGDGTTECLSQCKCHWEIRKVGESDWDVTWVLADAEHCPTCIVRGEVWNPLRIRDGVIERFSVAGVFI